MKKLLAALLAVSMLILCVPAVSASNDSPKNAFGYQTVSIQKLGAFEESYNGYLTSIDSFDGKDVRAIWRDGSDDTATAFNLYHWSSPLPDVNNAPIPLSTANYIIIDYYYKSPDSAPALVGNKMKWVQGRVVPEDNTSNIREFGWNIYITSRNGMVANKWDTLVLPVNEYVGTLKNNFIRNKEYYLHQMKLFPLEGDMGKNDVLYIGNITIQSWDPEQSSGISERAVRYFESSADIQSPEKAIITNKHKDLEYTTIPRFSGKAPENTRFRVWKNAVNGKSYYPGDKYQLLMGQDVSFYPEFDYVFDFSSYDKAYINGYPDGTFLPQNSVTRAEAAKIIASIVNPQSADMGTTVFKDVKPTDWYYNAVTTLESLGALDIWSENFEPNTKITRHELVEIVYAISDTKMDSMKLTYVSDVNTTHRYYDAVMYAMANGIITGYDDGSFKPKSNITRAETVTVINRMIGRVWHEQGSSKFSDIDSHWAKGQIIASATAKSEGAWTVNATKKEYVLDGTSAKDYITALHAQSKNLSGDAIRRGVDVISEQMKKDILSTPNTAEIYGDRIGKNVYYISEKNGNDENDGKSPETAVQTISGLNKRLRFPVKGTAILFERGGIYRGQISVKSGLTYGSYGIGDKPVISGSLKNYADAALWEATDAPNVYKLTDSIYNVGIIVFDHPQNAHGNYDDLYGKNRIFGKNISTYKSLTKDLEFFSYDKTLYLCSTEGNPGSRFSSIEIGTRVDVFDGSASNIVIDNLHIKHTGSHGVGLGSGNNVLVTNCEFSWLGGSLLGNHGETTTQYGNAVELYGNCNGYYVRNNWMWQIYDTAVTHQGKNLTMMDVQYSGNLMEYVHWGIECWLTEPDSKGLHDGYLAQYNLLRNGGYGWGSIVTNRQGSARLYSFSTVDVKNSNMHSEFNIIDRCSGYLMDIDDKSSETFDSNIYIQDEGKTLGGLKGLATIAGKNASHLIHDNLGDKNPVFVLIQKH